MTGLPVVNVIALDPGETTGIAHYVCDASYTHGDHESEARVRALFTTVQLSPDDAADYVDAIASDSRTRVGLTIGFERFVPRRRSYAHTNQAGPHHVIGAVIEIARRTHVPYIEQGPSEAKNVGRPATLRRLGLWTRGKDHANDAAAHALLMLIRLHPYEASRLYRHGRVIIDRT